MPDLPSNALLIAIAFGAVILFGFFIMLSRFFRKVQQGHALVRTGMRGEAVTFSGMMVYPIIDQAEYIDISVKRIEIERSGSEGLICKDNMRADIKVAFFVRVNKNPQDVLRVAQSIGFQRGSHPHPV